jgi:hypothetical protein
VKNVVIAYNKTLLGGSISDYKEPLRLHKVDETKWEFLWNEMVREYHYLGYENESWLYIRKGEVNTADEN